MSIIYGLHPFIMTKPHVVNKIPERHLVGKNLSHLGPWADVKTKRNGVRSNTWKQAPMNMITGLV